MRWHFWRWRQRNTDLEDEIAHDLAAEAEERIRSGIPREEAEWASHRDFGNVLLLKEDLREMWGWTSLQRLGQDIRYGWRTLCKNPLFTAMAVLSLALGHRREYRDLQRHGRDYDSSAAGSESRRTSDSELARETKQEPAVVQSHSGEQLTMSREGVKPARISHGRPTNLLRDHNNVFSTLFAYQNGGATQR